jgi:hypothetical protein
MKNPSHDERISSFLDDALPEVERSAFEIELKHNAELQQQVAELRQLRKDVALLPRYSVTEGFAQRVVAAAVAAQADENANITPVRRSQPVRLKTIGRGVIMGVALAASVAILMISLPWLNFGDATTKIVALNNGNQATNVSGEKNAANAAEPKPLDIVWSSLPGDGEALVLTIRSAQGAAAGKALQDALAEQGIVRLRPSEKAAAGVVFQVYRDRRAGLTGNDKSKTTTAAAALYLEVSREELESALTQLFAAEKTVEFVPAERLALAKPKTPDGVNIAAAEALPEIPAGPGQYVELNPSMYRLSKASKPATVGPAVPDHAAQGNKVRVLVLVEETK